MIMKKFAKPFISMPKHPMPRLSSATELPPPPPPPPLKVDAIIAQVYGPTVNIYKDIFAVSPTASPEELREAYIRIRNQTHAKLDILSSNNSKGILKLKERDKAKAKQKRHLLMQINAISEAYQVLIDVDKKKEYDKSIGLKEQVDLNSRMKEYLQGKQHNDTRRIGPDDYDIDVEKEKADDKSNGLKEQVSEDAMSVHHVDLNSRMKEYLKGKQLSDEGRKVFDDYDIIKTKKDQTKKVQYSYQSLGPPSPEVSKKGKQHSDEVDFDDYNIITTKEHQTKKVHFSLQTLDPLSPQETKKVPIVSPAGVAEFDDSLFDDLPNDEISPIARLRQSKEQRDDREDNTLADVFASYLNLNSFIKEQRDDGEDLADVFASYLNLNSFIKEQRDDREDALADVLASYLNLNSFTHLIDDIEDDERDNDSYTVGEDEWSIHGNDGLGLFDFAEEVIAKASNIADGLFAEEVIAKASNIADFDFAEEVMAKASNIADGLCQ